MKHKEIQIQALTKTQSRDTYPEMERVQIGILRRMTVGQRVELGRGLTALALRSARHAIQEANPTVGEDEIALVFVARTYGAGLAGEVRARIEQERRRMSLGDDILEALEPFVDALERLGIPYYVGGSLASMAWGTPRTTMDADAVVYLRPEQVVPLLRLIGEEYYTSEEMIRDAIQRRSSFNIISYSTEVAELRAVAGLDAACRVSLLRCNHL